MSIEKIDHDLCTGCGICVDICPMDVIRMKEDGEKAVIKYGRQIPPYPETRKYVPKVFAFYELFRNQGLG